ncbi:MAG: hypothetical protein WBN03_07545 [Desulfobacterales bacterium]
MDCKEREHRPGPKDAVYGWAIVKESGNKFAPGQDVETFAVRLRLANGHVGRRFHNPIELSNLTEWMSASGSGLQKSIE